MSSEQKPVPYLVGEMGPEIFVPSTAGPIAQANTKSPDDPLKRDLQRVAAAGEAIAKAAQCVLDVLEHPSQLFRVELQPGTADAGHCMASLKTTDRYDELLAAMATIERHLCRVDIDHS